MPRLSELTLRARANKRSNAITPNSDGEVSTSSPGTHAATSNSAPPNESIVEPAGARTLRDVVKDGLLSSTLLTIVVLPVLYRLFSIADKAPLWRCP